MDIEAAEHAQLQKDHATPSIGGTLAALIALEAAGQPMPFERTPFDAWARWKGLAPEREDNDRLEMGRLMEEIVATRWQRRTGLTLTKVPMLVHPEYPWYTCHMDRAVVEQPGDWEGKTVGWYPGRNSEWSDPNKGEPHEVPPAYLLQTVWSVGIPRPWWIPDPAVDPSTGAVWHGDSPGSHLGAFERPLHLAAQFDLDKPLRHYHWECDETIRGIHARMLEACQEWWERYMVKGNVPPAPSEPDAAKRWLKLKYPNGSEQMLPGNADFVGLAKAYDEARKQAKHWDEEKKKLGVSLGMLIGAAKGMEGVNGELKAKVTISRVHKESYVVKAQDNYQVNVTVKEVQ